MSVHSFTDYVSKKLDKYLWEAMEQYFTNVNSSCFSFGLKKVQNPDEVEIQDTSVKKVGVYDKGSTVLGFDALYEVEMIIYDEDRYHYHEGEYMRQWYLMECEGDLSNGLRTMEVKHIEPYYAKKTRIKSLSDSLVPIISSEKLEEYATEIVKKYYPEALTKPMFVDPMKLVEKMGLEFIRTSITKECDIFGQIYFVDSEAEVYDSVKNEIKKIPVVSLRQKSPENPLVSI